MGRKESQNNKKRNGKWHPETRALHEGWHPLQPGQPLSPPWAPSTVFRHPEQGLSDRQWSYTRLDNPNRSRLEATLASLEGGTEAMAFASGMAAVQAVFHILSPGDHVLLPDDLYHGVRNLIRDQYGRWGLSFDFVDMTDPESVVAAGNEQTRLLWIETPSNPMLRISDIATLANLASRNGWISVVDNTWATPVIQRPLELGADIVLYSTTKYLGGHHDVLGGALVFGASLSDAEDTARLRRFQRQAGPVPSPFDCWLLSRSLKTLFARLRTQCESARLIAENLDVHPAVESVHYPGLPDHPGKATADRQMDFPGAMISFGVRGDDAAALRVVSSSGLVIPATSLGGVESTWEHRKTSEYEGTATPGNLIRLSVGLEHPEDIWEDIRQALAKL
ncbi:MAG: aminotransferase class I/II-fold pyridoxal phosphate-dependent enzyme [Cyclonatronaceae bacterium]